MILKSRESLIKQLKDKDNAGPPNLYAERIIQNPKEAKIV
jgi:hypothetical protein